MKTKEDFQNRLAELQNETKALLANSSKRVKATRIRLNEITTEFYKTKEQWRITLGTSL